MQRRAVLAVSLALAPALAASAGGAHADAVPAWLGRALGDAGAERAGWPRRVPRMPLLDRAREASGASEVWRHERLRGEGAAVCLVDTGVDPRHRDFLDAEGRTRIAWLLDLGAPPRGVEPDLEARFGGAIWSRADLDDALGRGLSVPGDPHGHGTAMASIAAGDDAGIGDAEPGPLAGIAPRAALIVVRALREGARGIEDADIAAGAAFCFAIAGRGPAPTDAGRTVALVPLGGHDGAHDGTEPIERALTALAARGHAIVVAAGNDGTRPIHAAGRALADAPARIGVHLPSPRAPNLEHFVALVARTSGRLSLVAPDGTRALQADGELVRVDHAGGALVIDARPDPADDRAVVRALIAGGGKLPALRGGDYRLEIEGDDAPFDVWVAAVSLGPTLGAVRLVGPHVREGGTVTIPGTAPGVITVGASVSREVFGDFALASREDGAATYSSLGPTAAGAPRPDLIAPGGVVFAALSSDLVPDDETNLVGGSRALLDLRRAGEDRIAVAGSSVAAAIVAGGLALAYERRPAGARDREALLFGASGERWTPSAGFGRVRLDRFVRIRERTAPGFAPASGTFSLTRAVVTPSTPSLFALARVADANGAPAEGAEFSIRVGGIEIARAPIVAGFTAIELPIHAPAGERVTLEGFAGELALGSADVLVRIDEGVRGAARPGGGACAIVPAADASVARTALLAGAALLALAALTRWRVPRRRAG
jgi:hypothetical protein